MQALAKDFLDESEALHALAAPLTPEELDQKTAFKDWTINTVIRHLHIWNMAADFSLKGDGSFEAYYARLGEFVGSGAKLPEFECDYLDGLKGKRPRMGAPRFKSRKDNRQSIRFTANAAWQITPGGKLRLPKIGDVAVKWSRVLPSVPSTVTVVKDAAGRYFASFVVDTDPDVPETTWREHAWVRIPGKHRNEDAAWSALQDMMATRH